MATGDVPITAIRGDMSRSTKTLLSRTQISVKVWSELYLLHAAGPRSESVLRNFVERVCTRYSGWMCTHLVSYQNRLNALLVNALLKNAYFRKYLDRFCEGGYMIVIHEGTSTEERGIRPSFQREGDMDVEVIVTSFHPPSNGPYIFSQTVLSFFLPPAAPVILFHLFSVFFF